MGVMASLFSENSDEPAETTAEIEEHKAKEAAEASAKCTPTKFKTVKKRPHTKLYPTLEDPKDYLECTSAAHAPYRFDFSEMAAATDHLLSNGYVVIKNVLSADDLEKGKSLLWEFMAAQGGWDKKDFKTW